MQPVSLLIKTDNGRKREKNPVKFNYYLHFDYQLCQLYNYGVHNCCDDDGCVFDYSVNWPNPNLWFVLLASSLFTWLILSTINKNKLNKTTPVPKRCVCVCVGGEKGHRGQGRTYIRSWDYLLKVPHVCMSICVWLVHVSHDDTQLLTHRHVLVSWDYTCTCTCSPIVARTCDP